MKLKGENLGKSCNQLQEQMNKHEVKQSKQEFLHYIVQLNYAFVIKHQENFLTRFDKPIFNVVSDFRRKFIRKHFYCLKLTSLEMWK